MMKTSGGAELEDLACQAAVGMLMAITAKLGQFRAESRFTTWACKFVIVEVSATIGRRFWRHPDVPLDAEDRDRLADRSGPGRRRSPSGGICPWRRTASWTPS
jgi:RNA polymerase sigma-70 factor, ECF subfamily